MNIPTEYHDDDRLADAYDRGWNAGHGIACECVPRAGERIWTESDGWSTPQTLEECRDVHFSLCRDGETNSRSFSPFEFTASEFNTAGDNEEEREWLPDELWEAYEAGVSDAIAADVATYRPEDYRIEESEHE